MAFTRLTLSLLALALACSGTPAGVPLPGCPQEPSTPDTLIPHPTECDLFYLCSWGGLGYLKQCPEGLYFNPNANYCDFPYNVACGGNVVTEGPSTDTPPKTTEPPVVAPPEVSSKCPPPQETVALLPNPEDCYSFYMCVDVGVAFLHNCPEGLAFNSALQVCDYPENVACTTSRGDYSRIDTSVGGAEGTQEISVRKTKPVPPKVLRKCVFGPKGEEPPLQANPSNCQTFYQCVDNGIAVEMPCAADLYFHAKRQICDYQKPVNCPH